MGFFGHVVASRVDGASIWPGSEPLMAPTVRGVHLLRVPERLGDDWSRIEAFVDRATEQLPGGFLSASVFDSDGAFVHVGVPGEPVGRCWLHLDGILGHFLPPWAPFDEEGGRLAPDAEAAQEAEWEQTAAAYRAELQQAALPIDEAADLCIRWARASGLEPEPIAVVSQVLDSHEAFVEDTFDHLLGVLGARRPTSTPSTGPSAASPS